MMMGFFFVAMNEVLRSLQLSEPFHVVAAATNPLPTRELATSTGENVASSDKFYLHSSLG